MGRSGDQVPPFPPDLLSDPAGQCAQLRRPLLLLLDIQEVGSDRIDQLSQGRD
jgi:hypothetical protein